jgi:hypothetical protein
MFESVTNYVRDNASAVTYVMGALVIVVIALAITSHKYKKDAGKAGFGIAAYNNLNMGGMNNPMWYLGSDDAGWGGPVHRESTPYNMGTYVRGLQAGFIGLPLNARMGSREGMEPGTNVALSTAGPNPPTCAAGMTPTTIQNADGSLTTMCISGGPSVINDPTAILSACGQTWDPAATAEAQALATVGSYGHSGYGERKLQSAVDAAYDSNVGLTDDQLAQAMAGGAP